jgi:hypothetical protein
MNPQDRAFSAARDKAIASILSALEVSASTMNLRCVEELQLAVSRYAVEVMAIFRQWPPIGDPAALSDSRILHIFVEVANGRGEHGSFLVSFAEALQRADPENFSMLRLTALEVINKYGLAKYLDNFAA